MPLTKVPDELISSRGRFRAWAVYNGTKDTTGATSTSNTNRQIVASFNVTSVSRSAAGTNVLNVPAGVLDDANNFAVCSAQGAGYASQNASVANTTTTVAVTTRALANTAALADIDGVFVGVVD